MLPGSDEQEEDIFILAENGEQEEDTIVLAESSDQEEDTVRLAENGKQEEEIELAWNCEDCGSGEEFYTEQYSRNEADAQVLGKLLEFQEVERGELQIENEQLNQKNTKLQEEIDQL